MGKAPWGGVPVGGVIGIGIVAPERVPDIDHMLLVNPH